MTNERQQAPQSPRFFRELTLDTELIHKARKARDERSKLLHIHSNYGTPNGTPSTSQTLSNSAVTPSNDCFLIDDQLEDSNELVFQSKGSRVLDKSSYTIVLTTALLLSTLNGYLYFEPGKNALEKMLDSLANWIQVPKEFFESQNIKNLNIYIGASGDLANTLLAIETLRQLLKFDNPAPYKDNVPLKFKAMVYEFFSNLWQNLKQNWKTTLGKGGLTLVCLLVIIPFSFETLAKIITDKTENNHRAIDALLAIFSNLVAAAIYGNGWLKLPAKVKKARMANSNINLWADHLETLFNLHASGQYKFELISAYNELQIEPAITSMRRQLLVLAYNLTDPCSGESFQRLLRYCHHAPKIKQCFNKARNFDRAWLIATASKLKLELPTSGNEQSENFIFSLYDANKEKYASIDEFMLNFAPHYVIHARIQLIRLLSPEQINKLNRTDFKCNGNSYEQIVASLQLTFAETLIQLIDSNLERLLISFISASPLTQQTKSILIKANQLDSQFLKDASPSSYYSSNNHNLTGKRYIIGLYKAMSNNENISYVQYINDFLHRYLEAVKGELIKVLDFEAQSVVKRTSFCRCIKAINPLLDETSSFKTIYTQLLRLFNKKPDKAKEFIHIVLYNNHFLANKPIQRYLRLGGSALSIGAAACVTFAGLVAGKGLFRMLLGRGHSELLENISGAIFAIAAPLGRAGIFTFSTMRLVDYLCLTIPYNICTSWTSIKELYEEVGNIIGNGIQVGVSEKGRAALGSLGYIAFQIAFYYIGVTLGILPSPMGYIGVCVKGVSYFGGILETLMPIFIALSAAGAFGVNFSAALNFAIMTLNLFLEFIEFKLKPFINHLASREIFSNDGMYYWKLHYNLINEAKKLANETSAALEEITTKMSDESDKQPDESVACEDAAHDASSGGYSGEEFDNDDEEQNLVMPRFTA